MPRPTRRPRSVVQQQPLQVARPVQQDASGFSSLGQGLQNLGGGLARAQAREDAEREREEEKRSREEEKAREEALAMRVSELEASFVEETNEQLYNADTGLLRKNAVDASRESPGFYDKLEERRQKLAEQIPDERARRIFLLKTRSKVGDARMKVESYVFESNEKLADSSLKILEADADARVRENAGRFGQVQTGPAGETGTPEAPVNLADEAAENYLKSLRSRLLSRGASAQEAEVLVQARRGAFDATQVDALIDAKRFTEARSLLADPDRRRRMGDRAADLDKRIEEDGAIVQGSDDARELIAKSVNAEGRISRYELEKAKDAYLKANAGDTKRTTAFVTAFAAEVASSTGAFTARVQDEADAAYTEIVNNGYRLDGPIARRVQRWLNSPEVNEARTWKALMQQVQQTIASDRRGSGPSRAQQAAMTDFWLSYPANRDRYAANPAELKAEWRGRLHPDDLETASKNIALSGIQGRKAAAAINPAMLTYITKIGGERGKWKKPGKGVAGGPSTDEQKVLFSYIVQRVAEKQQEEYETNNGKIDQVKMVEFVQSLFDAGSVPDAGAEEITRAEAELSPGTSGAFFVSDEDRERALKKLRSRKTADGYTYPLNDEFVTWLLKAEQNEKAIRENKAPPFPNLRMPDIKAPENQKARELEPDLMDARSVPLF